MRTYCYSTDVGYASGHVYESGHIKVWWRVDINVEWQSGVTVPNAHVTMVADYDNRTYRELETAGVVTRLDLELARESLGVLLARMEEGRASLREVEAGRYLENEKWIAFYDARRALELARYQLLRRTGGLLALFQGQATRSPD